MFRKTISTRLTLLVTGLIIVFSLVMADTPAVLSTAAPVTIPVAKQVAIADEMQTDVAQNFLPVTIKELGAAAKEYNGQYIEFYGEVVGEAVDAGGDFTWLTVVEDGAPIAIYMSKEHLAKIQHYGRYMEKGTYVKVQGLYSLDCFEHSGLLDVHAQGITPLYDGYASTDEASSNLSLMLLTGLALLALAGVLYWIRSFIIKKQK